MRTAVRTLHAGQVHTTRGLRTACRISPITPATSQWLRKDGNSIRDKQLCSRIRPGNTFTSSCHPYNVNSSGNYGERKRQARGIPDFDLSGKVIIVTGGAGGLGVVQAEALLEAGATVYALDRRQDPGATLIALQDRAKSQYETELHYRQIDVRDTHALDTIIANIASTHGRLDGLLACAGVQQETPALDMSQEDTNRILEINVTGVFTTAQAVARQMIKYGDGGAMAFIASMSGYAANRGLLCAAYNSSKAAVHQLGRSLAAEWGAHGIRVNTISPGYIVTPMVEELFKQFPDRKENWPKENMLNRVSRPEDYRGAAVYLMSDASAYMTGADMRIDGGHMAW